MIKYWLTTWNIYVKKLCFWHNVEIPRMPDLDLVLKIQFWFVVQSSLISNPLVARERHNLLPTELVWKPTLISALSSANWVSAIWLAKSVSLFNSSAFFWRAVKISTVEQNIIMQITFDVHLMSGDIHSIDCLDLLFFRLFFILANNQNYTTTTAQGLQNTTR